MKRNRIRLTEGQLHRVIKESINNVLLKEYKNSSTRLYNDLLDFLLYQGYEQEDAEEKVRWYLETKGEHKNYMRHYGYSEEPEYDSEGNRAVNNFMDDKDDEWWEQGKRKIVSNSHVDDDGNEHVEEYVDEYPCKFRPSPKILRKYMAKHNRPLDTRYGIERHPLSK